MRPPFTYLTTEPIISRSSNELFSCFCYCFVTDPPQVTIRMGKSLVAADIREGVDVYFNCVIRANPPPNTKIVTWLHNVSLLQVLMILI